MRGFLWIAACGAAALVGATVREAPTVIQTIDDATEGMVLGEYSTYSERNEARRTRGDSEFDRAQARIEAQLDGEVVAETDDSVTSADLEQSISEAANAITAANERIAEIQEDEDLSDEDRAAALAEAREARSAAINQLQQAVPGDSEEVAAEDQIAGGIEQMVLGIVTAAEESGATVSRDGEVLTGEDRERVFDEARASIREEFDN